MKAHWWAKHDYRAHKGSGRPNSTQAKAVQEAIAQNIRPVSCQRLFAQGPGSHYIPVAQQSGETQPNTPVAPTNAVEQLVEQVREYQRQDREAAETIIQAGDLDEATPWLNRTGWIRYLQGVPRRELLESMERPQDDADGPERAALAIWEAINRLAAASQEVAKACGHLLRIDITRTMKDESPHSPLLAYLNPAGIQKHVAPWQRIMMFFARTQVRGRIFDLLLLGVYFEWTCGYHNVSMFQQGRYI